MDRRDFPAVHLRNISQMRHIGKVPFGYGDGRFLNLAGPDRTDTAPGGSQREHADPVKKAPQLNVRHGPGCRVPSRQAPLPAWSPQCPAARQPQYRFSHPRPQRCRRQSEYGNAAAYPIKSYNWKHPPPFAFFQGIKLCPDLLIHICGHSRDPF